jgi:Tol biopolymer transport system component/DNA-binding winged helix-turn-helix (wHTH) protein
LEKSQTQKLVLYWQATRRTSVAEGLHSPPIIHFGVFEVDLQSGELRKAGLRLKLTGQPFQVLAILLERPGDVVTREELQKRLWPDTFVDIDHNLNTAINKIREVLGDSPESPRWIETVPRRGYKFIAPLEIPVSKDSKMSCPVDRQETPRRKDLLKRGGVVAGVAVVLLICVAIWSGQPRSPSVTSLVRITNDGKTKSPSNPPVTDGVHLYFIEGMPWTTGSGIAQLSATGGETTWITTTLRKVLAIYGISPDRSELLVASGILFGDPSTELWVQPLPAGAPRRVGNIIASAACWTPDGIHVVYASYGGTIMIANKDGSEPHQLAKVSGIPRVLRFSPDGLRIRFHVVHPWAESTSIWEMDANGKDIHRLLPDWKESPYQCCGNWSPDGDYYYFQASQGIWVMPERRSIFRGAAAGPSRLTFGPLLFRAPVASGDGKSLFVVGEEPRVELFRYDVQARRLDSYLGGLSAGPVDFSSDGKWMAYVSYPDMTLWRSRVDGSEKMQLTFPPVRVYAPRWSPDGSKIAFMDVQLGRPYKIRLLSSFGSSPELLLPSDSGEAEADPTWMPDGNSIVLAKFDGTYKVNIAIYRLDSKTSKVSSIPDSDGLFSPRVSPDGRYISALTYTTERFLTKEHINPLLLSAKLMLFDTNTNHWSSLVEGEWFGYNEWSHDGKYIYMRENRGGSGELIRVRLKDRVPEQVLSLRDFPQRADIFAGWIGLTPDDAPLLMRDRSVQEIYALDLRFH